MNSCKVCGKLTKNKAFCSIECNNQNFKNTLAKKKEKIFRKCVNCEKETANPKFCSQSCSATWTNKNYPKNRMKKQPRICQNCGKEHFRGTPKTKYCQECYDDKNIIYKYNDNTTVDELMIRKGFPSGKYMVIRNRSLTIGKKLGWTSCANCGYDKHVQICHIRAISDFPKTATLAEINSISNLLPLCPNCHWEADHLDLDIIDVKRKFDLK